MNAREIQRRIMADGYKRQSFTCPNYTPRDWFECDVIEVKKSGLVAEYEIKLSRADFKADTRKYIRRWSRDMQDYAERHKHPSLAAGDPKGPNYFWFVCPSGVLTAQDMPPFAGLMTATYRNGTWQFPIELQVQKPAPRIHKQKINDAVRNHLLRTFYHRFQWWFLFRHKEAA